MKGAPLRIELGPAHADAVWPDGFGADKYVEAIAKLIPGEIVGAYLAGTVLLEGGTSQRGVVWWAVWTLFCLAVVIGLRKWMTSDEAAGVPAQWSAVSISALSFLVWVYFFGDLFDVLGWWNNDASALVLIGWTLVSPLLLLVLDRALRGS
jgi:hypothetical protein